MLLCLTKIDDLPEVEGILENICQTKNWSFIYKNAPVIEDLIEIASEVCVIFMNPNKSHIQFTEDVLRLFTNLQVFCTASTGTVHIDLEAAADQNIHVISIKKFQEVLSRIPSTAELAVALTLDGVRKVTRSHNDVMKNGSWDFENFIGKQIKDLNVGVIGYGRLGRIYAKMMVDAGARVALLDPRLSFDFQEDCRHFLATASELDVVSLHLHAEGNEQFLNNQFFSSFKDDIVLVNTSRGEVVDHPALLEFLDKNPGATYCTDVVPDESSDSKRNQIIAEFKLRNNVLLTQHIGGMSSGARKLAFGLASNLLLEYFENYDDE